MHPGLIASSCLCSLADKSGPLLQPWQAVSASEGQGPVAAAQGMGAQDAVDVTQEQYASMSDEQQAAYWAQWYQYSAHMYQAEPPYSAPHQDPYQAYQVPA